MKCPTWRGGEENCGSRKILAQSRNPSNVSTEFQKSLESWARIFKQGSQHLSESRILCFPWRGIPSDGWEVLHFKHRVHNICSYMKWYSNHIPILGSLSCINFQNPSDFLWKAYMRSLPETDPTPSDEVMGPTLPAIFSQGLEAASHGRQKCKASYFALKL